jgi:uncharacterized delta-60 repeat protein
MKNILHFGKTLLLTCILFSSDFCMAQVTQKWVQRQTGDANSPDVANGLAIDHNNNVLVTGWSTGNGTGNDFTTIRYDNNSNTKWVKRYNGPGNGDDQASAIAIDHKGNVYVTGWSTGSGTGFDFTTIKYDDDGDTKWVKRYNGPGNGNDQAMAIAVDDDGNVYITGQSTGSGSSFDYTTIKYDDDGDVEWVKRYNGPGNASDQPTAIAVDDNGNVYVTGSSTGSGTGFDYATIKYDDDGNQEWVQRYNGPINAVDRANDLAIDDNGNVYVSGRISTILDSDANLSDIATIKYNSTGIQQWVAIYNRKDRDEANAIAIDASGNVYITGVTGFADEGSDNEYVTVKYNAAGVQQWDEVFTGDQRLGEGGEANDLVLDAAGNVYITGALSIREVIDYVTVKYNTNGVQQWVAIYDGPGNNADEANAIGLDGNGNVFITGGSMISENDYATIKYLANGTQKWVKRYNGPGNQGSPDVANALAVDGDGNVHVTGGIIKTNLGSDFTTYKYDEDGDREWKKTYNGPGTGPDEASDIALDAAGNVYITGKSFGSGTSSDFATIKYDDEGNTKWVRRYNGPGNGFDQPNAITVDNNGNVYVTGWSSGSGRFSSDYTTIKYSNSGDIIWIKRYNGPGNFVDRANAIVVDAQGNVYVTGTSSANGASGDYTTIKYDANGNELWVARYDGPGAFTDDALALAVDASGNVYITGGSYDRFVETATIKYNAAGVEQWIVRYNSPANSFDEGRDIAVDASGNVYIAVTSQGGATSFDYATIKYNSAGVQQWEVRYNGQANDADVAEALVLDAAGDVYVTGGSTGNGTGLDYATVKYNAAGVQQWEARYNGPGNGTDIANAIVADDEGNVYVTGRSTGIGTGFDYATIKYEQTLNNIITRQETRPGEPVTAGEPVIAKLQARAYPNAFNKFINLQWSGSDKPVNITITDAMGRLVEKRTGLGASGIIKTGFQFRKGIYYALIVQGTDKLILKLIKN